MDSLRSLDRGSFNYQHPIFGSQRVTAARSGLDQNLGLFPPPRPTTNQGYSIPKKEDVTLTSTDIKYFDRPLPSTPKTEAPKTDGPGWRFHAAFACLCLVNLVCALDATSLAVAIPVRRENTAHSFRTNCSDRCRKTQRKCHRSKLVGNELFADSHCLPAYFRWLVPRWQTHQTNLLNSTKHFRMLLVESLCFFLP